LSKKGGTKEGRGVTPKKKKVEGRPVPSEQKRGHRNVESKESRETLREGGSETTPGTIAAAQPKGYAGEGKIMKKHPGSLTTRRQLRGNNIWRSTHSEGTGCREKTTSRIVGGGEQRRLVRFLAACRESREEVSLEGVATEGARRGQGWER